SGDTTPYHSSAGVCRTGVTWWLPSSATIIKSRPSVGVDDQYRACFSSGETLVGNTATELVVSLSALPVPSAGCDQRLKMPPPLFDANTIRLPSGVHTGTVSTDDSRLNRVSVAAPKCQIHTSFISPSAETATRVPSGEI